MKKIAAVSLITIFLVSVLASPAFAGAKQRYRWQGVAIGIGATLLGQALMNNYRNDAPQTRVVYEHSRAEYRPAPPPVYYSGHWEVRKVWVPPVRERVWNPAHYDAYNRWVTGRYITIEKSPGYWQRERVWVSR